MSGTTSTSDAHTGAEPLNHDFTAVLQKSPSTRGWTYVVMVAVRRDWVRLFNVLPADRRVP